MSKRVLIYESLALGHRAYYTQVLAEGLIASGFDVTLAMPAQEIESPEGACTVQTLLGQLPIHSIPSIEPTLDWKWSQRRFQQIVAVANQLQPDHLYIPSADGIAQVWGSQLRPGRCFPRQTVVEGLMMRATSAYPSETIKQSVIKRLNTKLVMRSPWHRLHYLDPLSMRALSRTTNRKFAGRLRLLPEAIEPLSVSNRATAIKILGLREFEGKFITCPGEVDERKGSDLLIQAFQVANLGPTVRLILAGRHSAKIRHLLANDYRQLVIENRIISIDRFATNAEFDCLFAIADLVATPYSRHMGSSSIVIRGAHAGKKILASNWGWVGWATQNFSLGVTCDVNNVPAFAEAIKQGIQASGPDLKTDRQLFLQYHTLANHQSHWLALIRELTGLPAQTIIAFPFPSCKSSGSVRLG